MVIPAFVDGHEWAACFGLSWTAMMLRDQASSQRMIREGGQYLRKVSGTMGVAEGRNEIAAAFLKAKAEWLFMVDTDMGFEPDTVDRLVATAERENCPIVGGLAFALKRRAGAADTSLYATRTAINPTLYRYVDLGTEKGFLAVRDYEPDAFQYVDATGAACLLIHRDALQAMEPAPFRPMVVRDANPDGTDRAFSEDLSFCSRAAAAGQAVGVDTSVKTTHYKGGIFLDEETYRIQRAVREASPIGIPARSKVPA